MRCEAGREEEQVRSHGGGGGGQLCDQFPEQRSRCIRTDHLSSDVSQNEFKTSVRRNRTKNNGEALAMARQGEVVVTTVPGPKP